MNNATNKENTSMRPKTNRNGVIQHSYMILQWMEGDNFPVSFQNVLRATGCPRTAACAVSVANGASLHDDYLISE